MSAKDYHIVIGGMSGKPYIAKLSKSRPHQILSDRHEVDKSEFIQAILEWAKYQLEDNQDTVFITESGNIIAEIKITNPN